VGTLRGTRNIEAPEIEQVEVIAQRHGAEERLTGEVSDNKSGIATARLLWNERRLIGLVVLRGTLLFLAIALLWPASYDSQTQLMPPDQHGGALSMLAALAGGGGSGSGGGAGALGMLGDVVGMKTSGALFVKMLQSDTVQDDLINRFDLRRVYGIKTYQWTREKLSSRTAISEDKKSGVISISVTDHDPNRAAALAQAYVDELNHMVVSLDTSAAHRERVFLEERLKVVRQELDVTSKAFSEFASKNTAIDIKEQGKAMVESAAILQGQLIAAESELSGLEQIYAPSNVRVRSLQARVSELQRQLEKMGGSATDDSSGSSSDQMYPSIRQLPLLGVPYYNLFREFTISETVYEILTKQYEMSRIEEAKEVPSIKVIDVAQPPEKRSGPSRTLIVLAGLLFSTLGVCGWIVGQSRWQAVDDSDPGKSLAIEVMVTQKQWLARKWNQVSNRFHTHADLG